MTRFELFWRNAWLSLRRSPRDKRALQAILSLMGLIAYFAYLIIYFGSLGLGESICVVVLLALGFGCAGLIRWKNTHATNLLNLSSYKTEIQEFSNHRQSLAELLLRDAIVLDRAGVEVLHKSGKLTAEHTGACRRRTLDLAQRSDLWGHFTEEDRSLLLSPEGSWNWELIWPRIALAEDVRVLRWVLQLDSVLVPFEFLELDLRPAIEITTKSEVVHGTICMPPWELRPARDMARAMTNRCIAEGLQRGFFSFRDYPMQSAYLELAETLANDESSDLLTGIQTVAKSSEDQIRNTAQVAYRRAHLLDQVITYLGGDPKNTIDKDVAEMQGSPSTSAAAPQSA